MNTADSARETRGSSTDSLLGFAGVFLLLGLAAGLECVKLASLREPGIWGHLRAGAWILQNKAWPHTGIFSQAQNLSWQDFSWGYDALAAVLYRLAGLRAVPLLLLVSRFALALISFLLAGGWRNLWPAVILSATAQYVLFSMGPSSAIVSVVFGGIELLVLFGARESGSLRMLRWLPALFVCWANLDGGFVYGIALYGIFVAASLLEHWQIRSKLHWLDQPAGQAPLKSWLLYGGACVLASLLNPYTIHAYGSFLTNEFSPVNQHLPFYTAMSFRQPQDYVLMLLGMVAYLGLGLRRSRNAFSIGVLVGSMALAFHAQREAWVLALASAAVIGHCILRSAEAGAASGLRDWNAPRLGVAAAALSVALVLFFAHVPKRQDVLLAKVAEHFPVRAADFLRTHPQPAPFFNVYQWGAFLTWYLPEYPVAIDGRRGLYPEETELGYFKAMNADIPYRQFPPMNRARTFLMDKAGIMGEALRGVKGFQAIYEDNLSIVYSHETQE
jgi:hypothetical protein